MRASLLASIASFTAMSSVPAHAWPQPGATPPAEPAPPDPAASSRCPASACSTPGRRKPLATYPRAAALIARSIGALVDDADNSKSAESWYIATGVRYGLGCGVDLVTPSTVNEHNRRSASYAIMPMYVPGGGGLAIGGEL